MKQIAAIAGMCVALGAASVAYADDSATNAYGGAGGDVPTIVTPSSGGPSVSQVTAAPTTQSGAPTTQSGSAPVVAGAHAVKGAAAQSAPAAAAAPTAAVTPARPAASAGSLPFTGLDVGLMAAGGLLLLGFGLAMRRLSRRAAPLA